MVAFFNGNPALSGIGLAAITSLDTAFPKLNLSKYLTEEGRRAFGRVRAFGLGEEFVGFGATTYDEVTNPDVTTLPAWRQAMTKSRLGNIAPQVPTYLFNGNLDTIVPAHMTPRLFNDWCSLGARTEFTSYPADRTCGFARRIRPPRRQRLASRPTRRQGHPRGMRPAPHLWPWVDGPQSPYISHVSVSSSRCR